MNGACLVCTSNIVPDGLYKDGLQRARFLPRLPFESAYGSGYADGGTDYRLRTSQAELYHFPLGEGAEVSLRSYERLAVEAADRDLDMEINSRQFRAIKRADDVIWFDYAELCNKNLAARMITLNWRGSFMLYCYGRCPRSRARWKIRRGVSSI